MSLQMLEELSEDTLAATQQARIVAEKILECWPSHTSWVPTALNAASVGVTVWHFSKVGTPETRRYGDVLARRRRV